jgi:hypothetical protein
MWGSCHDEVYSGREVLLLAHIGWHKRQTQSILYIQCTKRKKERSVKVDILTIGK